MKTRDEYEVWVYALDWEGIHLFGPFSNDQVAFAEADHQVERAPEGVCWEAVVKLFRGTGGAPVTVYETSTPGRHWAQEWS